MTTIVGMSTRTGIVVMADCRIAGEGGTRHGTMDKLYYLYNDQTVTKDSVPRGVVAVSGPLSVVYMYMAELERLRKARKIAAITGPMDVYALAQQLHASARRNGLNANPDCVVEDSECQMMVANRHGLWTVGNTREILDYSAPGLFCAIGSGREFALGALEAGAACNLAIDIASRYDPMTGNGYTVATFSTAESDSTTPKQPAESHQPTNLDLERPPLMAGTRSDSANED